MSHSNYDGGGDNNWLTPPWILQALGHFDMDPACPQNMPWATADMMLTDGSCEWLGRVFLNPPYGNLTPRFMRRMATHGDGVALVAARTETQWFYDYVWQKADAVHFFKSRIRHYKLDGSLGGPCGFPSCLVAYGFDNVQCLIEARFGGRLVILQDLSNVLAEKLADVAEKLKRVLDRSEP